MQINENTFPFINKKLYKLFHTKDKAEISNNKYFC